MFYRLLKLAPFILSFLGICLGVLGYLIDIFVPRGMLLGVWFLITSVLIINGILLGNLVMRLAIKGYTDELTGLGNKGLFYLKLKLDIEKVKETDEKQMALAMIDIDNFKQINDTYGHPAGDRVLKGLANVLKHNVRVTDTVVRWGGEEFAVIMPHTNLDGALALLERMRGIIENYDFGPVIASNRITVSTGIVTYSDLIAETVFEKKERNLVDLFVDLADKALYRAKEQKNRVVSFRQLRYQT